MRKIAYKKKSYRVNKPILKRKKHYKRVQNLKHSFVFHMQLSKPTKTKKHKKKKRNTPWKSVYQFKRRKSSDTVGHPVWVYKKRGRTYKYLTFTHNPPEGKEQDFEQLLYNIDPDDAADCYVKKQFEVNHDNAFRDPDKNYRIHEKDKATIKKYQK